MSTVPAGLAEREDARHGTPGLLDRLAALLSALGDAGGPLTAGELAERAGLPESTTYRLLRGLDHHGLVDRNERGSVELGLRLLELARRLEERIEDQLVEPARGPMRRLALEHGETVLLTAPLGERAICLAAVESPRPVRLSYDRWRSAPIHLGASGRVLLAYLDAARRNAALAAVGDSGASGRPPEPAPLEHELAEIRAQGYVVSEGELDEGATAVGAPILDRRGRLIAGLSVAGPSARLHDRVDPLVAAVRSTAGAVSRALADAP